MTPLVPENLFCLQRLLQLRIARSSPGPRPEAEGFYTDAKPSRIGAIRQRFQFISLSFLLPAAVAFAIATMPGLMASGSCGHAFTTSARTGDFEARNDKQFEERWGESSAVPVLSASFCDCLPVSKTGVRVTKPRARIPPPIRQFLRTRCNQRRRTLRRQAVYARATQLTFRISPCLNRR